jgi:3-hydroxyacyl-CoA dehydrogenase/enoyl-CoA hydratase/3-hydroxybutyryl-CoA epimerase
MAASKGYQAVLREGSEMALGSACMRLLTLFEQDVAAGTVAPAAVKSSIARIHETLDWKPFTELELVIAATNDAEKMKAQFLELEKHTRKETVLVNTGLAVALTELQERMLHPERAAGLHFLAPTQRSLLVEVVASDWTRPEVARRLIDFVSSLGRVPWLVKDRPGLLIDRVLIPYCNEALLLVKEGLDPVLVDEAMTHFGMAHGPLAYLDLMGLDVAAALVASLGPGLKERLTFDDTFAHMVERGWLGQKSGLGFYRYRKQKRSVNHPLIASMLPCRTATLTRSRQLATAKQRLTRLIINEAAWCLAEGRAENAAALDLAFSLAGWAPHRGGPLLYTQHLGVGTVTAELKQLAARHGPRYEPCRALQSLPDSAAPAG